MEVDMSDVDFMLRKFQKELSAGTVSLLLLAQMAKASTPLYGYQIAKQLEQAGDGILAGKQSALYPVLRNLEATGLLQSEVEPSVSGPPRRYYQITDFGREVFFSWRGLWQQTQTLVNHTLEGAPL
jgi:PadR family transcriptional regulator, regulatory protein PadR